MQFYCGRMFNFFRFRESENSVVLDLLPSQRERIDKGEATLDTIYDEVMADPKVYVDAVKQNGITNLMTICGSLGNNDERSNGTGKSTVLESITFALYGCIVRQAINSIRNESIYDVITSVDGHYPKGIKESWVEWLFEEKGKLYVIRRGANISGKSRTPILNFSEVTTGARVSLSGHRTKDTGADILKVIGYDFDVFSSSIMFGQNDAGKFLIGKDKDRKEMIVKILHLEDVVAGCLDSVRELKNEKEKDIKQLNIKSELITQWLTGRSTIDYIKKKISDAQTLINGCDVETNKNNGEIDRLSKSDILKELEAIKTEGQKAKADISSKKTELSNQTKEWTDVLSNIEKTILNTQFEISNSSNSIKKSEAYESELAESIKLFDLGKANKDLTTVEKAKTLKPAITKQYDDLVAKERKIASDIAVEDSNIRRLTPELDSLKRQLQSAGHNEQFVCDKCKSVVPKKHIEGECQKISGLIDASRSKKAELDSSMNVLKKEFSEVKVKTEKVEDWLIKEGGLRASIQKYDRDKALLVDVSRQVVEKKEAAAKLVKDLESFQLQKKDCDNRIKSISDKYQDEIKGLEVGLNGIRDRYLKAESDSKEVKTKIEEFRRKNEGISNGKSKYSSEIGSMNKEIENIEGETKKLVDVKREIEEKTKDFQRYILLDDIFGLEGIQTRIVNKYLPALNRYIEEFLTVLSNGEMTVEITTNSASAIDINIRGNTGDSYNMISGGEKGILRLSVSIGLALLSFVRTAQKPEMICLDEIFGPLDPSRRGSVFQLLSKLQSRFSRVIVISHNADINENIPNGIMIEKTEGKNGISKIKKIV